MTEPVPIRRRNSVQTKVGDVLIGGSAAVVVQSMTDPDTADAAATARQVLELAEAGSEVVRITINNSDAAAAVEDIRQRLDQAGCTVPLVGDFHYNGHKLLSEFPGCAETLDKYRINPGERRSRRPVGQPVPTDDRTGLPASEARANRCQLGISGPGAAGPQTRRKRSPGTTQVIV